jgi:hypothetical protein
MGLTALLPLRFLSPLKIHQPRSGLNPRTLGPVASTLTTSPPRSTLSDLIQYKINSSTITKIFLCYKHHHTQTTHASPVWDCTLNLYNQKPINSNSHTYIWESKCHHNDSSSTYQNKKEKSHCIFRWYVVKIRIRGEHLLKCTNMIWTNSSTMPWYVIQDIQRWNY